MTKSIRAEADARRLVLSLVGGRPHLIKSESVHRALRRTNFDHGVLRADTPPLSDYPNDEDFDLPAPGAVLTHREPAALTAALTAELLRRQPGALILYGDLAATGAALPAALSAGVPVVHVESGYRSGDPTDPEEKVRILASKIAVANLAYSETMVANLLAEGIPESSVFRVPDPAHLSLLRHAPCAQAAKSPAAARGLITFHHDETFETPGRLRWLVGQLRRLAQAWPLHVILYRRTARDLRGERLLGDLTAAPGIVVSSTLPYKAYISALEAADFVVTDSSGVQDDCVTFGKPCVVARRASPRPVAPPLHLVPDIDSNATDLAGTVRDALEHPPTPIPTRQDFDRFADGLREAIQLAARAALAPSERREAGLAALSS